MNYLIVCVEMLNNKNNNNNGRQARQGKARRARENMSTWKSAGICLE
jgi:hypothetical protein